MWVLVNSFVLASHPTAVSVFKVRLTYCEFCPETDLFVTSTLLFCQGDKTHDCICPNDFAATAAGLYVWWEGLMSVYMSSSNSSVCSASFNSFLYWSAKKCNIFRISDDSKNVDQKKCDIFGIQKNVAFVFADQYTCSPWCCWESVSGLPVCGGYPFPCQVGNGWLDQ